MKKYGLPFLIAGLICGQNAPASLHAQSYDQYFIGFTDKNTSPYSVDRPLEFLSQRALDRRARFGISVTVQDLPPNPAYLDSLRSKGALVHYGLRWFNGAVISAPQNNSIPAIYALPFVDTIIKVLDTKYLGMIAVKPGKWDAFYQAMQDGDLGSKCTWTRDEFSWENSTASGPEEYGRGFHQAAMLGIDQIHAQGFKGEGMLIAVLDAGFDGADASVGLNAVMQDRILAMYDFVDMDADPLHSSNHGRHVLNCMAAIQKTSLGHPENFLGTAPAATYVLLRTEDIGSEFLVEEYHWAKGAEFADSIGADILNSSLGYTDFDDPATTHTYEDMDGNTAPATRAGNLAFERGIIVVNSAGNEGNSSWHYIGAPADGQKVLGIGAVDSMRNKAGFSSFGPSSSGQVKPDVAAQGGPAVGLDRDGFPRYIFGTSFSSPVMAGALACYRQKFPNLSPQDFVQDVYRVSHQYTNPDSLLGYGIPNFGKGTGSGLGQAAKDHQKLVQVQGRGIKVFTGFIPEGKYRVQLLDLQGRVLGSETLTSGGLWTWDDWSALPMILKAVPEQGGRAFTLKLLVRP